MECQAPALNDGCKWRSGIFFLFLPDNLFFLSFLLPLLLSFLQLFSISCVFAFFFSFSISFLLSPSPHLHHLSQIINLLLSVNLRAASAGCQWLWSKPGSGGRRARGSCWQQAPAQLWRGAWGSNRLSCAPAPGSNCITRVYTDIAFEGSCLIRARHLNFFSGQCGESKAGV